jgi:hypothetical protein
MGGRDEELCCLDEPRDLTSVERALVERLLEVEFAGRDALREQFDGAQVTAEGCGDTRTIRFRLVDDAPQAATSLRVPVEGETADADGMPIAILLHVIDGRAAEVEIYRVDGEPLRASPAAERLTVAVNEANNEDSA